MDDFIVTGTHIWYFYICHRELWLISHQIVADQDNENIQIGRYLDRETYSREHKSLFVDNNIIDVFHDEKNQLIIGEVKKSSKYRQSAKMQLAYYIKKMKENGINVKGELRFPLEKTREEIILNNLIEDELNETLSEIERIVSNDLPPTQQSLPYCKTCGYLEFCWSE